MRIVLERVVVATFLLLASGGELYAAPKKPKPPAPPKMADFNKAMSEERYADAQKLAGGILQLGSVEDRTAVSLAYGRILLVQGDKADFREYRKNMRKLKLRGNADLLMQVYEAWFDALAASGDAPLEKLRAIVGKQESCEVAAEAADVLAILYLARGDRASAQKAVDEGLKLFGGYTHLKTAYIENLLRKRMKVAESEAQKLYAAAEKHRVASKFLEAGRLYMQLCGQFAADPLAQAARFRVGECLQGLDRPMQALEHWKKFVKEQPAGPWRGQARVAMADHYLEQFDLPSAAEQIHQAAAVLDNTPPSPSGRGAGGEGQSSADHSWADAAYEIHLHQAIVALLSQQREQAATALKLASQSATAGSRSGVNHLAQAVDKGVVLLPADLGTTERGVGLVLGMARIASLMERHERAGALFAAVHSGRVKGASPLQNSFAALGLARELVAQGKSFEPGSPASGGISARDAYLLSLRDFERAPWHDGTLRELALLTEQHAASAAVSSGGNPGAVPPKNGPSVADALPYWQKLMAMYPASPYAAEALLHSARLRLSTGQWRVAVEDLEKLVKDYPANASAGDAHVFLIDLKLECLLDLDGAQKNADAAVAWLAANPVRDSRSLPPEGSSSVSSAASGEKQGATGDAGDFFSPFPAASVRPLRDVTYDIYLHAGLLEYLHEQFGAALTLFEKAKPFAPLPNYVVVQGHIPSGIERLIDAAKTGKSLTPDIVRKGDATAKTAMMLADVYHEAQQYQKSLDMCSRLLNSAVIRRATPEQKSYAYFKRARNHYRMRGEGFDFAEAEKDYASAVQSASKAPWASQAMFLAANIEWNHKHNAEAAIGLWKRIIREYPDSKEAEGSTIFISVVYRWTNRLDEARQVLKEFLAKHPDSRLAEGARKQLEKIDVLSKAAAKAVASQGDSKKNSVPVKSVSAQGK